MDYKNGIECAKMTGIEEGLRQGIEEGLRQGKEKGIKQGREEGIEQGEQNKKIEIIKEMLKLGVNKEIICQTTKIKEEELEKIQKDTA